MRLLVLIIRLLYSNNDIFAGLWAVVNNAGILFPGLIEWQTVEEMTKVVDVNVWGMVSITKAFLPLLKGTKGRVVNVASCLGRVSFPGGAAYCISKFGVQAFSDALRCEMLRFGVTVHIIEPGFFRTNITDPKRFTQHIETLWKNLDANTKESYGTAFYEKLKSIYFDLYFFISLWTLLAYNTQTHKHTIQKLLNEPLCTSHPPCEVLPPVE